MISQRTISNHPDDTQLLNLDPDSPQRGPFLITQVGSAPGDPTSRERFWVLRKSGDWADFDYYLANGLLDTINECLFDTAADASEIFHSLHGGVKVADLPVDLEALKLAVGSGPVVMPGLPRLKAFIARYKAGRSKP